MNTKTIANNNIFYANNNIASHLTISPTPFSMSFSWEDKSVSISLKDGNDLFKIAKGLMEWMDNNDIEYKVKTTKRKK